MVTARAADVTALSVTGQISGSHHGWNPSPAWRARPACCTDGRADTPRQLERAAECESEWSRQQGLRTGSRDCNTKHVGGRGGVLCTSKSVVWCPFHQGRSRAALGCKTDENVNFCKLFTDLRNLGGSRERRKRGVVRRVSTNQVTVPPVRRSPRTRGAS